VESIGKCNKLNTTTRQTIIHIVAKPVAKVLLLVIYIPTSGFILIGQIKLSFLKLFVTILGLS
jgi:hypothetical protein